MRTRTGSPKQKVLLILASAVLSSVCVASSSATASSRAASLAKTSQSWVQLAELIDGGPNAYAEVAMSNDTVVVGDYSANSYEGVAYVFVNKKSGWVYAGQLTPSNGGGEFGRAVAISGNTIVVGAYGADDACVFVKPKGGWTSMTETAQLTPSELPGGLYFGTGIAIAGNTVVVAASGSNLSGAVYVFEEPSSGWSNMTQTAELTSTKLGFGEALATDGEIIAVADAIDAVYVFKRPANGWENSDHFNSKLATESGIGFGVSIGVANGTIVVGALYDSITYEDQGAAYVYTETRSGWSGSILTASDAAVGNEFGTSVAISNNTIIIGSPANQVGSNVVQGASYLFVKPATGWATMTETAEIFASDGAANDNFGSSVAIFGNYVVAAGGYSTNYKDSAVYVFGP